MPRAERNRAARSRHVKEQPIREDFMADMRARRNATPPRRRWRPNPSAEPPARSKNARRPTSNLLGRRAQSELGLGLVTAASATCHLCRGRRRMPPVSSKCAHRPSSLTSMRQPSSVLSMESANHACARSALSKSLVATTLPYGSMTLNATMRDGYPGRSVFNPVQPRCRCFRCMWRSTRPRLPAWPRRCGSDARWRPQPNSVRKAPEGFGS